MALLFVNHRAGECRAGEAHLVDPDMGGKPRCHRPFPRGVEASVPPELGGFLVDPQDPGDDPHRAVEHDHRHRLPYRFRRQLGRGERRSRGVGEMPAAGRAFVSADPVGPPPVPAQRGFAFGASGVPFVRFRELRLHEPGPRLLPPFAFP